MYILKSKIIIVCIMYMSKIIIICIMYMGKIIKYKIVMGK